MIKALDRVRYSKPELNTATALIYPSNPKPGFLIQGNILIVRDVYMRHNRFGDIVMVYSEGDASEEVAWVSLACLSSADDPNLPDWF